MPEIAKERVRQRLLTDATNSNHVVWLWAGLRFLETSKGWIFAYKTIGDVTLLALEPLASEGTFREAWAEFTAEIKPRVTAFVSVYKPFASILEQLGFTTLRFGRDPWVRLADCIPRGNAGKGVRSARNQALLAGLRVEEWTGQSIASDSDRARTLNEIFHEWKGRQILDVNGFLNSIDLFAAATDRRYFIARSSQRVEAFLVASPVNQAGAYFLEDLVTRTGAPRGAGELLTLEAMVVLRDSGVKYASLGVVSATSTAVDVPRNLPRLVRTLLITLPALIKRFYNFEGLELYRKRFKPHEWKDVFLAVGTSTAISPTRAWLKTICAIARSFQPRLRPSMAWLRRTCLAPFLRYPITTGMIALMTILFGTINRFGKLSEADLTHYSFFAEAPWQEWLSRSVSSDLIYFDRFHFLTAGTAFVFLMVWAERRHKRNFLIALLATSIVSSDILNYWIITKPFQYFQPHLFAKLIAYKDVGISLVTAVLVGLQISQIRRIREQLFSAMVLGTILVFAFTSPQHEHLILNLNHAVFLIFGYMTGKTKSGLQDRKNKRASKGKAPKARSVLQNVEGV